MVNGSEERLFKYNRTYNALDGAPCPAMRMLLEKKRCNEFPCFSYYWHTTQWSKCHFNNGRCGSGKQYRETHCYKSDGKKLSPKRCVSLTRIKQLTNHMQLYLLFLLKYHAMTHFAEGVKLKRFHKLQETVLPHVRQIASLALLQIGRIVP